MSWLCAAPLIAVALLGRGETDEAVAAKFSSQAFGIKYKVTVTPSALHRTPDWDNAENPPISAKKAATLATAMKDSLVNESRDVNWELKSLGLVKVQQKWLWTVRFEAKNEMPLADPIREASTWREIQYLMLVVLMDGTVIRPTVEQITD